MAKYYTCPKCGQHLDHGEKCDCGWYEGLENEGIVYIGVEHIHPHPNNPRKDLGDLSELKESISKNGIMQNLTVIPANEPGEYITIIGHRRCAAAKEAGLNALPCRVVYDMSENEQLGIMLEENMLRDDLTILEQAESFQLMLDLGETEDSIAEKTGFSKTTVKRRLNIAKLDQDLLREKIDNESFQMNLSDLYELEKIKDVKERNKILKNAYNSNGAKYAVKNALDNERLKENFQSLVEVLESIGIQKAPKEYEKEKYSSRWKNVGQIYIGGDNFCAEDYEPDFEIEDDMYYVKSNSYYVHIITEAGEQEETEQSEAEITRKRIEVNRDKINFRLRQMDADRKYLIDGFIEGKFKISDESKAASEIWHWLIENGANLSFINMVKYYTETSYWSIKKETIDKMKDKFFSLKIVHSMFIALYSCMAEAGRNLYDWQGYYGASSGEKLKSGYEIFAKYLGWCYEKGDEAIINGTSELYENANKG